MTVSFKTLGWDKLDWHSQAEMLDQLNREFEEMPRPAISPEFLAELERRSEQCRLHPEDTIPAEQVFAELLAEFGE